VGSIAVVSRARFPVFGLWDRVRRQLFCCYQKQLLREISYRLNHVASRSAPVPARRPAFFATHSMVSGVERAALRELWCQADGDHARRSDLFEASIVRRASWQVLRVVAAGRKYLFSVGPSGPRLHQR
jgi:hypothetical protein